MGLENVGEQIYNYVNRLYVDVKIGVKIAARNENSRFRIAAKTAAAIFAGIFFTAIVSGSIGATLTIAATLGIGAFLYAARQESQIRFHEGTDLKDKAIDMCNKLRGAAEDASGNTTDLKTDLQGLFYIGVDFYRDAQVGFRTWKNRAVRTAKNYMPNACFNQKDTSLQRSGRK